MEAPLSEIELVGLEHIPMAEFTAEHRARLIAEVKRLKAPPTREEPETTPRASIDDSQCHAFVGPEQVFGQGESAICCGDSWYESWSESRVTIVQKTFASTGNNFGRYWYSVIDARGRQADCFADDLRKTPVS